MHVSFRTHTHIYAPASTDSIYISSLLLLFFAHILPRAIVDFTKKKH